MKAGFSHFDGSGKENFCAAVILLTMEVDPLVKELVARLVRTELGIDPKTELLGFGREARLEATDDGYARVDLLLQFGHASRPVCAFVEVKTHDRWTGEHVAHQVRDQSERRLVRGGERPVQGVVLLAPERLCARVRAVDSGIKYISWPRLFRDLRALRSPSPLTELTIRHLEEKMDRPPGLNRPMSLDQFEEATTTIACLREFIVACIEDMGGSIQGDPMYLTPGDGQPRRGGQWAWHGLSVPFSKDGQRGRVGIYRYKEAPPGEGNARTSLWLEAYLGEEDDPKAFVEFAPPSLSTSELDSVRKEFVNACRLRLPESTARRP